MTDIKMLNGRVFRVSNGVACGIEKLSAFIRDLKDEYSNRDCRVVVAESFLNDSDNPINCLAAEYLSKKVAGWKNERV